MNLLLLHTEDFTTPERALLQGRRAAHLRTIQQVAPGDCLRVGQINGRMGTAIVTEVTPDRIALAEICLTDNPPPALPLTLVLSLPRPKMLRRIFQTAATMGVKHIILVNSARVEKSFWQSPFLAPDNVREQLILGLEQAKDTHMPSIEIAKRFKPFVEDELAERVKTTQNYVAHPYQAPPCPREISLNQHCYLAIGPEGGYVPYEVEKLQEIGFNAIGLGPRILRVETALPVLLAKLYPIIS